MKKVLFFIVCSLVLLPISSAAANSIGFNKCSDQEMLANFTQTGDPALDLYNFAKDNNLSMKKAKKILSKNFGTPKVSKAEYFNKIARTHNPDEDLRIFAVNNHLTTDEAKNVLTQIFGEPQKP